MGGLLVGGVLALVLAGMGLGQIRPPRPEGSGEVGVLIVYAQSADGPIPLDPGPSTALPRPQDFAFQFNSKGVGPRLVRIGLDAPEGFVDLYETRVVAPVEAWSLDYVAHFGEVAPDQLELVVTVEAPHQTPRVERYPFRLATASSRFWDPSSTDPEVDSSGPD